MRHFTQLKDFDNAPRSDSSPTASVYLEAGIDLVDRLMAVAGGKSRMQTDLRLVEKHAYI